MKLHPLRRRGCDQCKCNMTLPEQALSSAIKYLKNKNISIDDMCAYMRE